MGMTSMGARLYGRALVTALLTLADAVLLFVSRPVHGQTAGVSNAADLDAVAPEGGIREPGALDDGGPLRVVTGNAPADIDAGTAARLRRPEQALTASDAGLAPRPSAAREGEQGVTVRADRPISAASSTTLRDRDLELRPRSRPADLLEAAPGLVAIQHAGGGKANQYFLRGFDADHGTDIALSVDGVPFNYVSHAHGQGYADPHFIIPELVERIDVQEGPYFAASGDFATAGAIDLRLRRTVPRSYVLFEGGMYNRCRLLGVAQTDVGPVRGYVAGEVSHFDGPFVNPTNFNRFNVTGRWSFVLGPSTELSVTLTSYGGAWNASGQVPAREVGAGRLSRFGSIDPTEGGQSDRHSVYADLRARGSNGAETQVLGYVVSYRLDLFSNFTFFARDPVRGDQIEQTDARTIAGFRATHRMRHVLGGWRFQTTIGAQLRHDAIENALYSTQARVRFATSVHAAIRETSIGLFAEEEIEPARWLRVILGLRGDLFAFAVEDLRRGAFVPDPDRSGARQSLIASPKATLVISPIRELDVYLNFGTGFHSNDARGVVRLREPVTPLARAIGYEVGARWRAWRVLQIAGSLWGLDLESEIVYVGDEGTTEARGPTRRLGATLEGRWDITSWLRADADVSFVSATYTQNPGHANAVALAPPLTLSAGLSARHPVGIFAALRVRAIGDRPATEDRSLTAQGFMIFSAQAGFRHRLFEASVSVENLLDSEWREAQFANESRLRNEPAPVADVHFTPGTPFAATARLILYLP